MDILFLDHPLLKYKAQAITHYIFPHSIFVEFYGIKNEFKASFLIPNSDLGIIKPISELNIINKISYKWELCFWHKQYRKLDKQLFREVFQNIINKSCELKKRSITIDQFWKVNVSKRIFILEFELNNNNQITQKEFKGSDPNEIGKRAIQYLEKVIDTSKI